jgi:hypothetical protein
MAPADTTGDPPRRHGRLLAAGAVTGFVGMVVVVAGASQPGSPFTSKLPGSWYFGVPSSPAQGGSGVVAATVGVVAVYAGVAAVLVAWYCVALACRVGPPVPVRRLAGVLVAWSVPLLVGPPLFSRDVYAYAAEGQLVSRGLDPYAHSPAALGRSPFLPLVDPRWQHTHTPYGPGFFDLARLDVALAGHRVLATVVGFRVAALVGVVLVAVSVPVIARSFGRDPAEAFALAVLSPLVLFDLVGGAHNDSLMLGLLVAGYALARRGHPVAGMVLCALGAAVKVPAFIGVVYIGWEWAGPGAGRWVRARAVATAVGVGAAVVVAVSLVSGLGWGWVSNLADSGTVVSWLDPATALGLAAAHGASLVGLGGHTSGLVAAARALSLVAAAVLSLWLLVSSERLGTPRALGFSLLAVALLGPVVWPWYEVWGLVFLAVVAEGWVRRLVLALTGLACLADVPSLSPHHGAEPVAVGAAVVVIAAVAVGIVLRMRRSPTGTGAEPGGGRRWAGGPSPVGSTGTPPVSRH